MILLLRHGQTEFNLARRAQGRLDSPLTDLGRRQAAAMAGLAADLMAREPGPWRLVSSPQGRALATAEIVSARIGLPVQTDARLREHSMGEFDGLHVDEFSARLPPDVPRHERQFHAPGAETFEALCARISDFLSELRENHRLVLVSHGGAGRVLRGLYAGVPREAMLTQASPQDCVFRLQNGQIDRFECEPLD